MQRTSSIVFVNISGFPHNKTASVHKHILMTKALLLAGFKPYVVSKYNIYIEPEELDKDFEGVEYVYLAGKRKLSRNIDKFIGLIIAYFKEYSFLRKVRSTNNKNYLVLRYSSMVTVCHYWLLSKLLGYKIVINIMEYHIATAKGPLSKFKAILFDKYSFAFSDGAIAISNYLNDMIKKRYPRLPTIIIPVLADYSTTIEKIAPLNMIKEDYFLFCVGIGYVDTILFSIRSFMLLEDPKIHLVLVVSGKKEKIEKLRNDYANVSSIHIYCGLPYNELLYLYSHALALLIPMRHHSQDIARFPQKVAEYLSSGVPIITNNYGEISYYFTDHINAFVAANYREIEYAEIMKYIVEYPEIAKKIGVEGRKYGENKFHFASYGQQLAEFLQLI